MHTYIHTYIHTYLTSYVHMYIHEYMHTYTHTNYTYRIIMIMIIDHFYSATSSTTTQRRSRLHHGYYIGVSRRSAQATVGKGLAQGPYVTARAGVEPTTLRLKVIASTNAPSPPSIFGEFPGWDRLRVT